MHVFTELSNMHVVYEQSLLTFNHCLQWKWFQVNNSVWKSAYFYTIMCGITKKEKYNWETEFTLTVLVVENTYLIILLSIIFC